MEGTQCRSETQKRAWMNGTEIQWRNDQDHLSSQKDDSNANHHKGHECLRKQSGKRTDIGRLVHPLYKQTLKQASHFPMVIFIQISLRAKTGITMYHRTIEYYIVLYRINFFDRRVDMYTIPKTVNPCMLKPTSKIIQRPYLIAETMYILIITISLLQMFSIVLRQKKKV